MCRPPSPIVVVEKKQEYLSKPPASVSKPPPVKEVERPDIFAQMFAIQQYKRERDTIHQELLEVKKELSASLSREKAMNDKMDIIMLVLHKQRHKRIAEKGHPHITTL
jgi:hypothetical protein